MFSIVLAVVSTEAMVRNPRSLIMPSTSLRPFFAAAMSQSSPSVSPLPRPASTPRESFCSYVGRSTSAQRFVIRATARTFGSRYGARYPSGPGKNILLLTMASLVLCRY
ncbi:hypothetical protein FJTKL_08095 [Diaporthe vaccinii]|uniref:Secreted protein n=1 Tax=Diaporthe vaccinii TaxID=105482 RepID=A0ABR4ESJ3_9PEZI